MTQVTSQQKASTTIRKDFLSPHFNVQAAIETLLAIRHLDSSEQLATLGAVYRIVSSNSDVELTDKDISKEVFSEFGNPVDPAVRM